MPDCTKCSNIWKERYYTAEKNYITTVNKLIFISLFSAIIAFICVILTVFFGIKTQNFISQFEYVEETEIEIKQDEGNNAAVIGNGSEVNIYGTGNNSEKEEILEKKEELRKEASKENN